MPNFNIVVMGDHGVGKRALIKRLVNNTYENSLSVFNSQQTSTPTLIQGNDTYQFFHGDTNQESRWGRSATDTRTMSNLTGCHAAILVLDPSDTDSVSNFIFYVKTFHAQAADHAGILAVITKSDIISIDGVIMDRIVQIKGLAREHDMPCIEISSKTAHNIHQVKDWVSKSVHYLEFKMERPDAVEDKKGHRGRGLCTII